MDEIEQILDIKTDGIREMLYDYNLWGGTPEKCKCMRHSVYWGISFKLYQRPSGIQDKSKRYLIGRD